MLCLTATAVFAISLSAQVDAGKSSTPSNTLPLKPERKIEFTTDEGTWLSLTISPDSKTLLFELLGDIYSMPATGGKATLLVGGMSNDTQPVYSPDGKYIAFLSDRDGGENLWIVKADGSSPRQLSKDKQSTFVSPAWTPDSQYVAVSRISPQSVTAEIYMYHRDGGGSGVQVTKANEKPDTPRNERFSALGAHFSPDGKFIYYSRRKGLFSYNIQFPLWQVVRRDRVTGEEDVITESPTSAMRPIVSPDGKKMVFVTRYEQSSGLRIRDLNTGEEKWLKYPIQRDDQESMATRDLFPNYQFSADGKDIYLTFNGKIQKLSVFTGEHQTIPFTADVSLDAGPKLDFPQRVEQGPIKARLVQNPVPSTDGKSVVFSSLRHLYRFHPETGKSERLTKDDNAREFGPTISPDGQWVAYTTWTNNGGDIYKTRLDGSGSPIKLTAVSGYYTQPVWTPDGSKIVVVRSSIQSQLEAERAAAMNEIVWIPSAGNGTPTLITPARGAGRPHFVTSQPDRVYLYSTRGLASMRFDGSDRRTLIKVTGNPRGDEPAPVTDIQISPDGTRLIALSSYQLHVMPVPQAGGENTTIDLSKPSIPVKKITSIGADSFTWSPDSKTVNWSAGSSLFNLNIDTLSYESKDKLTPKEVAITIEQPRSTPKGSVVLRGAKVITMKGEKDNIENADLVITDNKIAAIGKTGSVAIPAGARLSM